MDTKGFLNQGSQGRCISSQSAVCTHISVPTFGETGHWFGKHLSNSEEDCRAVTLSSHLSRADPPAHGSRFPLSLPLRSCCPPSRPPPLGEDSELLRTHGMLKHAWAWLQMEMVPIPALPFPGRVTLGSCLTSLPILLGEKTKSLPHTVVVRIKENDTSHASGHVNSRTALLNTRC